MVRKTKISDEQEQVIESALYPEQDRLRQSSISTTTKRRKLSNHDRDDLDDASPEVIPDDMDQEGVHGEGNASKDYDNEEENEAHVEELDKDDDGQRFAGSRERRQNTRQKYRKMMEYLDSTCVL